MIRRTAILIFLAAIAFRFAYLGFVYDGPDVLLHGDSVMYLKLTESLWQFGDIVTVNPDGTTSTFRERAPGYIYFLAGIKGLIGDNTLYIVAVQAILDAFVCVLVGYLAGHFHQRLILSAGLLAAFNFNMIIHTALILSDSLFMLPFVAGLIASASYIRRPSFASAAAASGLFSIALLVRPVLLYFPPVLLLFFAIIAWHRRVHLSKAVLHLVVVASGFVLIVGPLLLRNQQEFGHFAFVSQTGTHAIFWVYPQAQEFANGVPRDESVAAMRVRLKAYQESLATPADPTNPFDRSAEAQKVAAVALWELGSHALTKAWAVGTAINLGSPAVISSPVVRAMERPSFTETPGNGPVHKIWNYLATNRAFTAVMLPAVVLTALCRILAGLGVLRLWPRKSSFLREEAGQMLAPSQTIFLMVVSIYFFAVTGPIVGVKYRLPLEPALDIFLAAGLLWVFDFSLAFLRLRRQSVEKEKLNVHVGE